MSEESDVLDFVTEARAGQAIELMSAVLVADDRPSLVDEDLVASDGARVIATLQAAVKDRDETIANLMRVQQESLTRLALAAEFKDGETGTHIVRIGAFAALLARECGMDRDYCQRIAFAAPLHDVGKIGTPDHILQKPGSLTDEERRIVNQHCEVGWRILIGSNLPVLDLAAEIAHTHHEKFNGTGYPRKLAGEAIPLSGRLVALVDFFDALTMNRAYRKAHTVEEALKLIAAASGTHFDPYLVEAFGRITEALLDLRSRVNEHQIDLTGLARLVAR